MKTTVAHAGICQSCRNTGACSLAGKSKEPVQNCEEFAAEGAREKPSARMWLAASNTDGREALGLCRDCRRLSRCMHSHREGGVWFCEEYE